MPPAPSGAFFFFLNGLGEGAPLSLSAHMSLASLQQQIQEVFKNQQEQLSMQLLQQKNAGIVSQEVSSRFFCPCRLVNI